MIICITPNPAIDRTIVLPHLIPGEVHRGEEVIVAAGGKGLNVARAIRILGGEVLCMGFAGGHTGHLLADLAQSEGLSSSWTRVDRDTRTCIILVPPDGDATVINEPGAPIRSEDWRQLQADVEKHLGSARLVCVSGSLPSHSSPDDFAQLLSKLVRSGKFVWVDTSGSSLNTALAQPGMCIKVNAEEIGRALGFNVRDEASAARAVTALHERGIRTCVITLGAGGAFLATDEGRWYAQAPRVRVVSTVGSGDSFLGGLTLALERGKGWREALTDGVAAGTANTLSAGGAQFTGQEFEEIRGQIQIRDW